MRSPRHCIDVASDGVLTRRFYHVATLYNVDVTLTHAVGFHSGCCVNCVTKKTVARHAVANHSSNNGTCNITNMDVSHQSGNSMACPTAGPVIGIVHSSYVNYGSCQIASSHMLG